MKVRNVSYAYAGTSALTDVTLDVGERQLVALTGPNGSGKSTLIELMARVLVGRPRLVLLDEPLAALDVSHVQQFSALLRDVVDRTGCSVVYASHDLNWAAAYADRMLVLQRGTLALDSTPSQVMNSEVVKELFDFDADVVTRGGRPWLVPRVGEREAAGGEREG